MVAASPVVGQEDGMAGLPSEWDPVMVASPTKAALAGQGWTAVDGRRAHNDGADEPLHLHAPSSVCQIAQVPSLGLGLFAVALASALPSSDARIGS